MRVGTDPPLALDRLEDAIQRAAKPQAELFAELLASRDTIVEARRRAVGVTNASVPEVLPVAEEFVCCDNFSRVCARHLRFYSGIMRKQFSAHRIPMHRRPHPAGLQ
jgi:transposase-like protein